MAGKASGGPGGDSGAVSGAGPPPARLTDLVPACSVGRTLATLADPWSFGVLVEAFLGTRRYQEFHRATGFPKGTLSDRLARMVARGILKKHRYSERPERFEYRLTRQGAELYPILLALAMWGARWLRDANSPRETGLVHKPCGRPLEPVIVCSACREPLDARDVAYSARADAGWDMVPKDKRSRRSLKQRDVRRREADGVVRTLDLVGDRWSFLVLREAFFGVRRFDVLRSRLKIARNILSDRLRRLTEAGIFRREVYRAAPERYEYRLTEKGLDLYCSLAVMMRWGDRWLDRGDGPPVVTTHRRCGGSFHAIVACRDCDKDIMAWDVLRVPGRATAAAMKPRASGVQ